jgi:hypothetical protein
LEGISSERCKRESAKAGSPNELLGEVEGWLAGVAELCGS